jgi:hypothetical protein
MRLWTLHPKYLDTQGLLAVWREGLLAQAVLQGKTRGYRKHPQLIRFYEQNTPTAAISAYLWGIYEESERRGYRFDINKILPDTSGIRIVETAGQLRYEWRWLQFKLQYRSPEKHHELQTVTQPEAHPLFYIVPGPIQSWEKVSKNLISS